MSSAAAAKGPARSDCSAVAIAAMPPASTSSVRSAETRAASAWSVPDDFAIGGFGLAMSFTGGLVSGRGLPPTPAIARPLSRRDASGPALNDPLTIIVLTPLTTFSASAWNSSDKYMNLLEYLHRGAGSSKGPSEARGYLPRAIAMPCAERLRRDPRPGPDRHAGSVQPCSLQPDRDAGFAVAPNRGRCQRQDERRRQRRQASRQG